MHKNSNVGFINLKKREMTKIYYIYVTGLVFTNIKLGHFLITKFMQMYIIVAIAFKLCIAINVLMQLLHFWF